MIINATNLANLRAFNLLGTAIKLIAQKQQLVYALDKIKSKKNSELANAFVKVFNLTSLLTIIWLPLCWLTDRKEDIEYC